MFVSDDSSIYVADNWNHRVVKWAPGVASGKVVAGTGIAGSLSDLLHGVDSFVFDCHDPLLGTPFIRRVDHAIYE